MTSPRSSTERAIGYGPMRAGSIPAGGASHVPEAPWPRGPRYTLDVARVLDDGRVIRRHIVRLTATQFLELSWSEKVMPGEVFCERSISEPGDTSWTIEYTPHDAECLQAIA